MASLSSLVASKGRGINGDTWTASRSRCIDLDFSILEIEMMRHNRLSRDDKLVTQPTMQMEKDIKYVKAMRGIARNMKNRCGQIIEKGVRVTAGERGTEKSPVYKK